MILRALLQAFGFVCCIWGCTPVFAGISELTKEYSSQIEKAKQLVRSPERITGFERFKLAYDALRQNDPRDNIGQLLLVLQNQNQVIEHIAKQVRDDEIDSVIPPSNGLLYQLGLKAIEKNILGGCKGCSKRELNALKYYVKIFDLHDMHDGFSGLPFYSIAQKRFHSQEFQIRTIQLYRELEKTLDLLQSRDQSSKWESAYTIALRVCGGKAKDATELLALLTSRDVLITRYLKYFKSQDMRFVRAYTNTAILIRLISELDQLRTGQSVDRFSYPELTPHASVKHYYFWSTAYAALKMKELGYSDETIVKVSAAFSGQYKALRYLEAFGPLRSSAWKQEFKQGALADSQMSAQAAQFSLSQDLGDESEGLNPEDKVEFQKFQLFLTKIREKKDVAYLEKKEVIESVLKKDSASQDKVYVLYYNFQSNIIGYPHLKLIVDQSVYEIHRTPNSDGTYLRERPMVEALKDARRGYLPSGILEVPITPDQKERLLHKLSIITDGSMKYAFFNRLFSSGTYNCAGVIYDAFYHAGFDLPEMSKWDAIAGVIIRKLHRNLPRSRFIGRGKTWIEDVQIPHWTLESIPKPLKAPRGNGLKEFSPQVGQEYLHAEQILVRKIPKGADPIHTLGRLIPSYSNTGTLDKKYVPTSSPVLNLTTLLIPEGELKAQFSKQISVSMRKITEVTLNGNRYYRFFIHPNELTHYAPLIRKYSQIKDPLQFQATPTSSARSLIVKETTGTFPTFGIKLSLSVEMGAAKRLIDDERATRSVYITDLLSDVHSETPLLKDSNKTWEIFKEVASFLPVEHPELGGYILRELPQEMNQDIHLPVFSLIAKRSFEDRWIENLFDASPKQDKVDFVFEDLVLPLLELHSLIDFRQGLTTELHQQNVVYVIDRKTHLVKGVRLKDMDAHWVDYSLREHRLNQSTPTIGFFPKDAYLLRFAEAPLNHFQSLVEVFRSRNVINTYKYFLSSAEMKRLLKRFDDYAVAQFNQSYPEYTVSQILDMEGAWKKIASDVKSAREQAVYHQIQLAQKNNSLSLTAVLKKINDLKIKCSLLLTGRRAKD